MNILDFVKRDMYPKRWSRKKRKLRREKFNKLRRFLTAYLDEIDRKWKDQLNWQHSFLDG